VDIVGQMGSGTILTFYSYKGGTGRSMALVNFACWLARRSAGASRVLLIDWDLEAPGLQRFFPESEARDGAQQEGLINYFEAIRAGLESDSAMYDRIAGETGPDVMREAFPLASYLMRDVVPGVDLLRAGRLDGDYARMVSAFNWIQFHEKYQYVFRALREMIATDYRYCLIDSRTGFNDVSGVCTMLMAEKLVLVFTPNRQSLSGVLDLATRAVGYRRSSDDFRPLAIFPLPSRIENAELDLKQQWRTRYQEEFEATLARIYELDACSLGAYFDDVVLPHVSYYSYGEEIAVLRESSSDALSLSRAYETFFRRLDEMEFAWDNQAEKVSAPPGPTPTTAADRDLGSIYISYAHIDNMQVTEGVRGWVDTFHRTLQVRLAQMTGRGDLQVWRDPKLAGNDLFSDELTDRIRTAGVFIAIVSPAYARSTWCRRELEAFLARGTNASEPGGRLIKVLKSPVPLDDQPDALRTSLGYEFFQVDPGSGRVREIADQDRDYFLRIDDLAHDMSALSAALDSTDALAVSAAAVYLAETTSDVRAERESIRRDLLQHGYRVLPDSPLPLEAAALEKAIREQLTRCRASVHLSGRHYGFVPEGDDRSVVEMQFDLAGERAASDSSFARIIWKPAHLEPSSDRQRAFIAGLQSQVSAGAKLFGGSLEELRTALSSHLQTQTARKAAAVSAARALVYVIFDRRDAEGAREICDYLFGQGLEIATPVWEGDESEIRAYHEELLATCDAALIYFGTTSEAWVRRQIGSLTKAGGLRSTPVPAAVIMGPPQSEAKTRFRTHAVVVIQQATGDGYPVGVKAFLDALRE